MASVPFPLGVGPDVDLLGQAPDQGVAPVEQLRVDLAEMREALDLVVEVVDRLISALIAATVRPISWIGIAAQRLHLVGQAADRPGDLVDRAQQLEACGRALRAGGERVEDLQAADLDREVAAVAGRAEGELEQVLVARIASLWPATLLWRRTSWIRKASVMRAMSVERAPAPRSLRTTASWFRTLRL